jgi:hypothetical protein
VGAVATAGLLHWTTAGPVLSAVAGGSVRRLTINLLETNAVDPWEVGIDAAVSGIQAWAFGRLWPSPQPGLDFTKPPLGEKVIGARDIFSAEAGVMFGYIRKLLIELYRTPYAPPTPVP